MILAILSNLEAMQENRGKVMTKVVIPRSKPWPHITLKEGCLYTKVKRFFIQLCVLKIVELSWICGNISVKVT